MLSGGELIERPAEVGARLERLAFERGFQRLHTHAGGRSAGLRVGDLTVRDLRSIDQEAQSLPFLKRRAGGHFDVGLRRVGDHTVREPAEIEEHLSTSPLRWPASATVTAQSPACACWSCGAWGWTSSETANAIEVSMVSNMCHWSFLVMNHFSRGCLRQVSKALAPASSSSVQVLLLR